LIFRILCHFHPSTHITPTHMLRTLVLTRCAIAPNTTRLASCRLLSTHQPSPPPPTNAPESTDTQSTDSSNTKRATLKELITRYGKVALASHVVLSLGFLGATYSAVAAGLDMQPIMQYFNIPVNNGRSIRVSQQGMVIGWLVWFGWQVGN
jgi:hypothetical protein